MSKGITTAYAVVIFIIIYGEYYEKMGLFSVRLCSHRE
jgi:hypothetical protein